jgi:hypothetical protein
MEPLRRRIAQFAALEFMLAILDGAMISLALMGVIDADHHILLGAHVATLTGALLLLGFGWSVDLMRTTEGQTKLAAHALIAATLGNWAISTFKAFWHVHGVQLTGEGKNDTIVGLLTVFVVAPTFVGGGLWIYGLFKKP